MIIIRNSRGQGETTVKGEAVGSFSGDVYLDRLYKDEHVSLFNVNFTPCARTNWHSHEGGQLLRIVAGSGWICDRGAEPQKVDVGDVIWCPPGTVHWHGADDESYMVHLAMAHGKTKWLEPVTDEEYNKRK